MVDCALVERTPTADEYVSFREAVGWGNISKKGSELGLDHSLYAVCAVCGEGLAGFGRVVGDGANHFYVVDVIVRPEYQRQGIGSRIMQKIMGYVASHAEPGAFVGLMAAKDAAGFYERFGFKVRSPERPGMWIVWGDKEQ